MNKHQKQGSNSKVHRFRQVLDWLKKRLLPILLLTWGICIILYGAILKPASHSQRDFPSVEYATDSSSYQDTLRANLAKLHTHNKPNRTKSIHSKSRKVIQQHQNAPLLMWQNEQTIQMNTNDRPILSHTIDDPSSQIVMGEIIPAVLETALDITQAGTARAMVTSAVYSYVGQHLLIPAGSRLVGHYSETSSPTQQRVAIFWHQLILPNGTTVNMNNPSIEPLGQSGNLAKLNQRRWLQSWRQIVLWSFIVKHLSLPRKLQEHWHPHHHLFVPQGTPIAVIVRRAIRIKP